MMDPSQMLRMLSNVISATCALLFSSATAVADVTVLASSGGNSPDGNGIYTAAGFSGNTLVDLNANGQVAFTAQLTATSGGTSDNAAIIRANSTGQQVLLRKGQYVDELDAEVEGLDIAPSINANGEAAFRVDLALGATVSSGNDSAVLRWSAWGLTEIVREGDLIEGEAFGQLYYTIANSLYLSVVLSDGGEVSFFNLINNSTPFLGAGSGGAIDQIFFNGFPDGNFAVPYITGDSFSNRHGQASLRTSLDTGASYLILESTPDGLASFQTVAKAGQLTPDGVGTFSQYGPTTASGGDLLPLNANGEIVFEARAQGALGSYEALFAGSPGSVREIAREGSTPNGSTKDLRRFFFSDMNDAGRVAFIANAGSVDKQLWLERSDFSGIDLMLETGQMLSSLRQDLIVDDIFNVVLNNNDQLVALVQLDQPSTNSYNIDAVIFYDSTAGIWQLAVYNGLSIGNSSISQFWFTGRAVQGRRSFNDEGQFVFLYKLQDGNAGVALWEPGVPYAYLDLEQLGLGDLIVDPQFEEMEPFLYRVANPEGKIFELSASPAPSYAFAGWSGDLNSSDLDIEFTLSDFQTLELTANFELLPPQITSQSPAAIQVVEGEPLLLEVGASGADLDFQWFQPARRASPTITDSANQTSYELSSVTAFDEGNYYVRVSNAAGSVDSATMVVTVVDPPVETWFAGASAIQPAGWRYFDWFKGFKPEGENWIYHGRHGWLFVLADNTSSMFLWDVSLGRWMFTNATAYPWMYAYGPDGGWVFFFEGGRPGARYFKRGDNGQVVSEGNLSL